MDMGGGGGVGGRSQNVYLILDFMFLYIILHEIYMINIDPITFFKKFLYIKDADHSSPKLILITILCHHHYYFCVFLKYLFHNR